MVDCRYEALRWTATSPHDGWDRRVKRMNGWKNDKVVKHLLWDGKKPNFVSQRKMWGYLGFPDPRSYGISLERAKLTRHCKLKDNVFDWMDIENQLCLPESHHRCGQGVCVLETVALKWWMHDRSIDNYILLYYIILQQTIKVVWRNQLEGKQHFFKIFAN